MEYSGKRVLVCGIARSGLASARLLLRLGAKVTAIDLKEADKLSPFVNELENMGVTVITGKNPNGIIKGFDLVIVSPGIPTDLPFFDVAFNNAVPLWGEIELAFSVCENPVLAITGTNGKTTVTAMLGEIMRAHNENSQVCGNIGTPFCEAVEKLMDFNHGKHGKHGKNHEKNHEKAFVVAEISSFQLETAYTFSPLVSAVLNISPDHLNRHKTMENYTSVKEKIFAKQKEGKFTVLNYDNAATRDMAKRARARVMFFSRLERLDEGVYEKDGAIHIKWNDTDEKLLDLNQMKVFGHNIENAMAAAGMAFCAGVALDTIRPVLAAFEGVEHRIEFIREINGVEYYNDSKATNVDSAIKGIEAMRRPIILIGGGKDKDNEFSPWVKLFAGKVKKLIVLGETADKIIETCKACGFNNVIKVNTLKDAADTARAAAESGDCVLLSPACASFDMFDSYEQRGEVFKEYVNEVSK